MNCLSDEKCPLLIFENNLKCIGRLLSQGCQDKETVALFKLRHPCIVVKTSFRHANPVHKSLLSKWDVY